MSYESQGFEEMTGNYEGACKLVAEMHAAAVGKITGPRLGVVEDVAAIRDLLIEARDAMKSNPIALYHHLVQRIDEAVGVQDIS